jgi:hypothetical protein
MTQRMARPSAEAVRAIEALEGAVHDLKVELMHPDGGEVDAVLARAQSCTRWLTQVRNSIAMMVQVR